jgi:hypothetical protein
MRVDCLHQQLPYSLPPFSRDYVWIPIRRYITSSPCMPDPAMHCLCTSLGLSILRSLSHVACFLLRSAQPLQTEPIRKHTVVARQIDTWRSSELQLGDLRPLSITRRQRRSFDLETTSFVPVGRSPWLSKS